MRPLVSPAYSSSRAASGVATVQRPVVAVDRPRPAGDRAAGGDLEHVGREAAVGEAQVERCGMRIALVLQVGDLGDLGVGRDRVGDRALDQRLVAQASLIGPGGRDDLLIECVLALDALLDRAEDPAVVRTLQRPVLADPGRLAEPAGALQVAAGAGRST